MIKNQGSDLNALVLLESSNDFEVLESFFSFRCYKIVLHHVSKIEMLSLEFHRSWDLIISDYYFYQKNPEHILGLITKSYPKTPFILFSEISDDVALRLKLERLSAGIRRTKRIEQKRTDLSTAEQLMAIVSHDIKNPISAIQLEAQILLRVSARSPKSELSDEVRIQANRILKTTERMKILISDLLDRDKSVHSLSDLHKKTFQANLLVQEVLDGLAPLIQNKNISVYNLVSENILINVDKNKIYQVFANLIGNSIKFSPDGGIIKISVIEDPSFFIFSVEDNGPGLSEDDVLNVFEKYWTGHNGSTEGSGLGLFICKTIVESHGGFITVKNLPTRGVCFLFSIPKKVNTETPFLPVISKGENLKRKIIYVVDDDDDLREVISWALSKEGYDVFSFHSPHEALNALSEKIKIPELIILDFNMEGIDGAQFIIEKEKFNDLSNCPIILISASPKALLTKLSPPVPHHIMTKPIDLDKLLGTVQMMFCSSDFSPRGPLISKSKRSSHGPPSETR
jgi:signal transduction histidine kinase/CheY-like chemotaxis protein